MGLYNLFRVKVRGFLGRLWVLSKDKVSTMTVVKAEAHFIHIRIEELGLSYWLYIAIYIHPRSYRKKECFKSLCYLTCNIFDLWILMGDFNEIMNPQEMRGGTKVDLSRC